MIRSLSFELKKTSTNTKLNYAINSGSQQLIFEVYGVLEGTKSSGEEGNIIVEGDENWEQNGSEGLERSDLGETAIKKRERKWRRKRGKERRERKEGGNLVRI